jgi:predicted nucleotidyltransferase
MVMIRILDEIKKEILEKTKDVELIFVSGSYVFRNMQKYSDLDLMVLTRTKSDRDCIFKFVEYNSRKILISIHLDKLSNVLKEIKKPEEWLWAYEFYNHAKVLYDINQSIQKIKHQLKRYQVSSETFFIFIPNIASGFLEDIGKLKNAYINKDELNIFYAAPGIASACYELLRPFNPVWRYISEKETYLSFIKLKNKPEHYIEDFKICYGITMKERDIDMIYQSALRIAKETIAFLKRNKIETKVKDKNFLKFFESKEYIDFFGKVTK